MANLTCEMIFGTQLYSCRASARALKLGSQRSNLLSSLNSRSFFTRVPHSRDVTLVRRRDHAILFGRSRTVHTTSFAVPDLENVSGFVQAGAVNVLLGAVAFQWIGMGALMLLAPQFREKTKEPVEWREIHTNLTQGGGVEAVPPEQVNGRLRRGAILLDVRTRDEAERTPLPSTTNIPMYRLMTGNDIFTNAKRVVFAWNGKAGTEFDPDWLETVTDLVPKGVIHVCTVSFRLLLFNTQHLWLNVHTFLMTFQMIFRSS